MKKSYSNDNPSKVVIVPKPPKSEEPDTSSTPSPLKDVLEKDVLKDVKQEKEAGQSK
ncbi:MAG: hypothetical protein J6Y06_08115 [Bacteroidales bacterium]|nr:hypothetical protein [Bacteroidales bacterium]